MWTVYMHICPDNKKYIGITSLIPEDRWKNGNGYFEQYFYKAIKKYGWDNIQHIILADGLTEDEAYEMEEYYIHKHKTLYAKHGYNITFGKNHIKCKEVRIKDLNLVFYSPKKCAEYLGKPHSAITRACKSGRKAYGHYFEYVDEGYDTDICMG